MVYYFSFLNYINFKIFINMAKPIFCVGIPDIDLDQLSRTQNYLENKLSNDYHVIVYFFDGEKDDIRFNCFHEKDFSEINFEELKEFINQQIQNK